MLIPPSSIVFKAIGQGYKGPQLNLWLRPYLFIKKSPSRRAMLDPQCFQQMGELDINIANPKVLDN